MKLVKLTVFIIAALMMAACDDTTDNIGSSITNRVDNLIISNATFDVVTRSIVADSVLSRNNTGLIGKVKDPETGAYVTGDYMTQFCPIPAFSVDTLQYIKDANNGSLEADSCYLLVSYRSTYGDTLAPMKVKAYEMTKHIPEDKNYYSNFDAFKEGYVDEGNYQSGATYTLDDLYNTFKIYLNKPYTKDGKTYKNYGSYILQTYEAHPEYFKNNYDFLTQVCPGFYLKHVGGIGNVANTWNTELQFYWKRQKTIKSYDGLRDSIATAIGFNRFDGTEETFQFNKITNDKNTIQQLANEENCTYIKSPAGIFTEATLPVEEIMKGHENDTLNTATVIFTRMNNVDNNNDYAFDVPSSILMIPTDSLYTFFENGNINNNRTSYTASYSQTGTYVNSYVFNNISDLITHMHKNKGKSENWNKVVLIPVTITTSTRDNQQIVTKINHDMALTSTRLVRGTVANPIKIKVIYSKFKTDN